MPAKPRILKATIFEREIGESVKAAKLKLRFDKVVRRLTANLQESLSSMLPEGRSVVITVAAPIKHPAKSAEELQNIVRAGLPHGEVCKTIHGNKVRIRLITDVATSMPRVLAFVHNAESDAGLILNIAESRLLRRGRREI